MKIVVMKFGGTSVRDQAIRFQALKHIHREVSEKSKVVVVVSAMGRTGEPYATDTLKQLTSYHLSKRENDRLLSCGEIISSIVMSDFLQQQGLKAMALDVDEVGIKTDDNYSNANIMSVQTEKMLALFEEYDVLVAPGFLGTTHEGKVTTLGRGGSDTSAVALGVALNASYVDIYSDVEGVMTADPKLVKNARLLQKISYDNLIALAAKGAKVIHLRAVELAKKHHLNLRLRSTSADDIGTYVVDEEVNTLSLAYKAGYSRYELNGLEHPINCELLIRQGDYWYAKCHHEEVVEAYLKEHEIQYIKSKNYVRVSLISQQSMPLELTFYVDVLKLEETLNFLHHNLI